MHFAVPTLERKMVVILYYRYSLIIYGMGLKKREFVKKKMSILTDNTNIF